MRFLVDAQLPPILARWLSDQGHPADHVMDVGLDRAKDKALWNHAKSTGAVLITKDEDFATPSTLAYSAPCVIRTNVGFLAALLAPSNVLRVFTRRRSSLSNSAR